MQTSQATHFGALGLRFRRDVGARGQALAREQALDDRWVTWMGGNVRAAELEAPKRMRAIVLG